VEARDRGGFELGDAFLGDDRVGGLHHARVEARARGVFQLDQRFGVGQLRAALGGQGGPGVGDRDDAGGDRGDGAAQARRAAAAVPPLADVAGFPGRAGRVAQRLAGVGDGVGEGVPFGVGVGEACPSTAAAVARNKYKTKNGLMERRCTN
jgi:hypothetical protein